MNRIVTALCLLLLSSSARAFELDEGRASIASFGEMAYGRTNGNAYLGGDRIGQYDNAEVALSLMVHPTSELLVGVQTAFHVDGTVDFDLAFAEWRFSDLLRFRAGKAKLPFGIYEEIETIGTLRPFFSLPQSIYGPSLIATESYLGAGITGTVRFDSGWALAYDAYGGALQFAAQEPYFAAIPGATSQDLQLTGEESRDAIGGRLILHTPIDGLNFRVSSYVGQNPSGGGTRSHFVGGVSVEYLTERWSVRSEAFRMQEAGNEGANAGYAEVAYFLTPHWQVAGRVDALRGDYPGVPSSSQFLRHRELALGLNYWFSPQFVIKASASDIAGNRFAVPASLAPGDVPDDHTTLFTMGAQFSF